MKLVIVGGGSSAWLVAAYLVHNCPNFNITIIDKEVGAPVGVGEATLLNFRSFLENCGFVLDEWFDELEATKKLGILFPNWIEENKSVSHPFHVIPVTAAEEYNQRLSIQLEDSSNVSYHLNCGKLTTFLQKQLEGKVTFEKSDVEHVERKGNQVTKLVLKNKKEICGDLFIDCTGFKSLLKDRQDKITLKDRLICDTAVAGSIDYLSNGEKLPYVICEAVEEGWVWSIPLQKRIGSGFIFNREITNTQTAKEFFVSYWANRITKEKLKVIDWTPYYDKHIWRGNVVSIGLSAGFLEPLESTGLALAMEGVYQLSKRIHKQFYNQNDIKLYNAMMTMFFENSIDFVNMHYLVSKRKGVFWDKGRQLKKSKKYLLYETRSKNRDFSVVFTDSDFFTSFNWHCWLIQSTEFGRDCNRTK